MPPTLSSVIPTVTTIAVPPPAASPAGRSVRPPRASAKTGSRTRVRTITRSSTISQPTAMRPRDVARGCDPRVPAAATTVLATERQRPKTSPAPSVPAPGHGECEAHAGGDGDLTDRAWHGDPPHRQQIRRREVQADAEHQQDDAHFGELRRPCGIGDEARREWADRNTRDEVADKRWQAQAMRREPEDVGQDKTHGRRRDQRNVVMHAPPSAVAHATLLGRCRTGNHLCHRSSHRIGFASAECGRLRLRTVYKVKVGDPDQVCIS